MVKKKIRLIAGLFSILLLSFLLNACASPTPQVVVVTQVVPATVMVTQIVTQMVTPEITPSPTVTPAPVGVAVIQPTPTFLPTQPTVSYGEYTQLKKAGYYVYYPLEDCGPSIVRRGFRVYVSYDGGKNAIRSSSDISLAGNIIGYALPGDYLKVIGGPVCSWGWLMWQVETDYELAGWTPESDGKTFWLIPVNSVP